MAQNEYESYSPLQIGASAGAVLRREELELQIRAIWGEVLGLPVVHVHQNFFDLGGESVQATELVARIGKTFGVPLHASSIFEASTIAAQADLIAGGRAFGLAGHSLVTLQASGQRPPIFFVHTHDGSVRYCRKFLPVLGADQPAFGLQSEQLAEESSLLSVEEMAAQYVKELLAAGHRSPFHLFGYCSGGLIAFEMALQLVRQNHRVAFLGMFDTPAPGFLTANFMEQLSYFKKRLQLEARRFLGLGAGKKISYLRNRGGNLRMKLRHKLNAAGARKPANAAEVTAEERWSPRAAPLDARSIAVLKSYLPTSTYFGRIVFFSTPDLDYFYPRPTLSDWAAFASQKLEVVKLPDDGANALGEAQVKTIAERLRRAVDAGDGTR